MKKTITVHIANFIFNIEEEAYQTLQVYLESISAQFSIEEERVEIMHDIESRIAELFKEKLSAQKEVVVEADVVAMIEIMGAPEEYVVEEESYTEYQTETAQKQEKSYQKERQIYRDTENAILGGVCSGLAAYFGIDPIAFRILFIVFTLMGGSGILIYLILYFAIPEAKTIAEKLRMKGEKIDVSSIKNQFDKVKNELGDETNQRKIKKGFHKLTQGLVTLFTGFIKVFSKFTGFIFLIGGIVGLVVVVIIFNEDLLSLISEQSISLSDLLGLLFESETHHILAYYSLIVLLLMPISYFVIRGLQLLFGIKNKFGSVKIAALTLWIISICMLFLVGVYLAKNFDESSGNIVESHYLTVDDGTILVELESNELFPNLIRNDGDVILNEMVRLTDSATLLAFPRLVVEPSETDSIELKIIKRARGSKEQFAVEHANEIGYNYHTEGNKIVLSNYFTIPHEAKFRGQNIKVVLKVPEGMELDFGGNIEDLMCSVRGEHDLNHTTWVNRKGRMINIIE
ncbi:MAG: PspC domain-containing protein [Flavobacteriales bacterium]|jgi:phage shock protein PspC (stress-responsive transcriptional regulator)|nr:PspC domain-containing protein [Flavobacteriales bacterium]